MKTINRKDFLKSVGLAGVVAAATPILMHCRNDDSTSTENNFDNSISTACSVTNSETEGPFPTKVPSSLIQSNIVNDRTGVPFSFAITIQNVNAACANLQGVVVDVWHCDKEGNYSEYGGSGMQSTNYTSVHFLRGRQTTDANGAVTFNSIFPGWYNGRATHIQLHIYKADGTSLLVTQIAFPEGSNSAVALVNASSGYNGLNGYTYNSNDNIFNDGTSSEMSAISGSVSAGYTMTHTIKVTA